MSTDKPATPSQGKPFDEVQSGQDANEAARLDPVPETQEAPEAVPSEPGTPEAEGTAAAETGVDKRAAGLLSGSGDDVPADAGDDNEEIAAKSVPDGEDGPRKAADAAVSAPADEDELAEKPAGRTRRRRGAGNAQPEPEPKPAKQRSTTPGVTVRAQAKYVRTSARKARIVCDHIRGKDVEQARAILAFTPRGAAEAWSKLLESAVANAEHNHELVGDELRVASVHADEGPTLKRFRPRAMGRATKIRKRTSHLTITLTPKD